MCGCLVPPMGVVIGVAKTPSGEAHCPFGRLDVQLTFQRKSFNLRTQTGRPGNFQKRFRKFSLAVVKKSVLSPLGPLSST